MERPFVLPFTARDRRYLYDVNTNNIMEVDELLYTRASQVCFDDRTGTFRPTTDAPSNGVDQDATLSEMDRCHRDRGFFSAKKPTRMAFPFSRDELGLILGQLVGHVILNVTENCNLRCSYCKFSGRYKHARVHSIRTMSTEVARAAIRFMVARSNYLVTRTDERLSVGFYGGEPLLASNVIRDCVQFVGTEYPHLKDRVTFALTTNLTLEADSVLDYLVDNDLTLTVSLDGPQALHDRYRRSATAQGTFDRVLQNLLYLRARSPLYYNTRVGFSVVLAPPYDLKAVVSFFANEELTTERRITLNFVDGEDTTFFDECCGGQTDAKAAAVQLDQLRSEYESRLPNGLKDGVGLVLDRIFGERLRDIYNRPLIPLPPTIYPNGICIPGFNRLFVSPDGRIYMCEKVGYDLPIGDICTGFALDAICAAIERFVSISDACLSCWAVRFCKMCFAPALREGQLDGGRKARNCQGVREGVLKALRTFPALMDVDPVIAQPLFKREPSGGGTELAFRFIEEHRKANGHYEAASDLSLRWREH